MTEDPQRKEEQIREMLLGLRDHINTWKTQVDDALENARLQVDAAIVTFADKMAKDAMDAPDPRRVLAISLNHLDARGAAYDGKAAAAGRAAEANNARLVIDAVLALAPERLEKMIRERK